jgi:DNA-binding CsgD family transcriptional regulator
MRCRLIKPDDLQPCLEMVHNSFVDHPDIRRQMPLIWGDMLRSGCLHAAVVEDPMRSLPERLMAVTLAVYVADSFLDAFLAKPVPGISKVVYEAHLAGRSVALRPEALRLANAGAGVNLLFLHYGARFSHPRDPLARQIGIPSREMIVLLHTGYRTKRVVQEVVGDVARDAMLSSGSTLVTDFRQYFEESGTTPTANDHPYLFLADPESTNIGSPNFYYFHPASPRFGFTSQQQAVLLHALFSENDEQIALSLAISPETVRKHWRAIYERVSAIEPGFFPGESAGTTRGPEKRRHLLNYLRFRLEEVRPGATR